MNEAETLREQVAVLSEALRDREADVHRAAARVAELESVLRVVDAGLAWIAGAGGARVAPAAQRERDRIARCDNARRAAR